jgi:hypothetical protein
MRKGERNRLIPSTGRKLYRAIMQTDKVLDSIEVPQRAVAQDGKRWQTRECAPTSEKQLKIYVK